MPTDHSQMSTLAALAKSAEARTPRPAPAPALTAGSGLIDLKEIDRQARESAKPSAPPSSALRGVVLDDEPMPSFRPSGARHKVLAFGAGAAVVVVGVALLVGFGRGAPPPALPAPVAASAPVVSPPVPVPAPVETAPPAPPAAAPVASAEPPKKGHAKGHKGTHRASSHVKLMKVTSGGT